MRDTPGFRLRIHRLRLNVSLGYGAEERVREQPVEIDLTFETSGLPAACQDDDTAFLCYDGVARHLAAACENREFKLIEFLARHLLTACRDHVSRLPGIDGAAFGITLTLTKIQVPVEAILGGCSVTLTSPPRA